MNQYELIGSKYIRVIGGGSQTNIRFGFAPDQLGESLYTMRISSIEDELNIANNQHSFSISILQDQYNVAILTGVAVQDIQIASAVYKQYMETKNEI